MAAKIRPMTNSIWDIWSESSAHPSKWHEALGIVLQGLAIALKPPGGLEFLGVILELLYS